MVRGSLVKSIPKLVSIFEHHAVVLKFLASWLKGEDALVELVLDLK